MDEAGWASLRRKRDAEMGEAPHGTCGFCGWAGPVPDWGDVQIEAEDADGNPIDVYTLGYEFQCPRCGRPRGRVAPGLWSNFAQVVKASQLPASHLQMLRDAISDLPTDAQPEILTGQFPDARSIIELSVKVGGKDWLAILALVLTIFFGYLQHLDAQKALDAGTNAQPCQPSQLTDQDIAEIAARIEADLDAASHSNAKQERGRRK
jgi:predicted RNA-binding Zn-ribbon protein involved in translation (DUF1610 family)